jgi:protein O-GlcNAc transferase
MNPASQKLQTAYALHQAGRLREAEQLYREVLALEPNHADTWHLLGLLAHQAGNSPAAAELIGRAIRLEGTRAAFHSNLGIVLRAAGQPQLAEAASRRALEFDPTLPEAHNNLGNLRLARGDTVGAAEAYRQAIAHNSGFADAYHNLGTLSHSAGQLDEAIELYRQAIQANPHHVDAHHNLAEALRAQGQLDVAADAVTSALGFAPQAAKLHLALGMIRRQQGRLDEAVACCRAAVSCDPRSGVAQNNLGAVLKEQGRLDEAEQACLRAIELEPRLPDAHFNLGGLRQSAGDFASAAQYYERALACDARFVPAMLQLGRIHEHQGRLDEALIFYERALSVDPASPAAHLYRAGILELRGEHAAALEGYRRAIELKPDYSEAYNTLARMYSDRGLPDQAIEYCRQGLAHDPESAALHANLATALGYQGRQVESVEAAREAVRLRPSNHEEFSNLLYALNFVPDYDPQQLFQEHLEWARRHAERLTAAAPPHDNDPDPERRLRVGYVSAYFREHAVNFFTEPLITAHDHAVVETHLYSDNRRDDQATRRLQSAANHWREVRYLSDAELAERIRADRIDVLVDLSGHMGLHRLLAFARRPAPVQVTYIGYQNTTGMSAMDYRLTDGYADPPGTEQYYTETLYRLPRSFFCYRPADDAPAVTPLPALERGYVTFGSFNNFTKVTPQVIDTWLEILARVPNSRLIVLANTGGYVQRHFEERCRARQIDPSRIEIVNRAPRAQYYELLTRADIALDPFPFNGHTTVCDCAWLGLPSVMLAGNTYASRFGGGVMLAVGLELLIADSPEKYIEQAVALAGDLPRLARLRAELRPRMAESVLLDFAGFARDVEAAYRQMWHAWCNRKRSAK